MSQELLKVLPSTMIPTYLQLVQWTLGQQGQTSPPQRKSTLNIHWKDWCWSWSSNTLAPWCQEKRKDPDVGKDWGQEKGVTENEMVGGHHCSIHEFEQTQGDSKGQGSLVSWSSWGCRVGHDLVAEQHMCFRVKPNGIWIPVLPLTSYGFLASS